MKQLLNLRNSLRPTRNQHDPVWYDTGERIPVGLPDAITLIIRHTWLDDSWQASVEGLRFRRVTIAERTCRNAQAIQHFNVQIGDRCADWIGMVHSGFEFALRFSNQECGIIFDAVPSIGHVRGVQNQAVIEQRGPPFVSFLQRQ